MISFAGNSYVWLYWVEKLSAVGEKKWDILILLFLVGFRPPGVDLFHRSLGTERLGISMEDFFDCSIG